MPIENTQVAEMMHRSTLQQCGLCASLLNEEAIREALHFTERCHALGPVLDPTSYRNGMQNLEDQRGLLDAALPLAKWAEAHREILQRRFQHDVDDDMEAAG